MWITSIQSNSLPPPILMLIGRKPWAKWWSHKVYGRDRSFDQTLDCAPNTPDGDDYVRDSSCSSLSWEGRRWGSPERWQTQSAWQWQRRSLKTRSPNAIFLLICQQRWTNCRSRILTKVDAVNHFANQNAILQDAGILRPFVHTSWNTICPFGFWKNRAI